MSSRVCVRAQAHLHGCLCLPVTHAGVCMYLVREDEDSYRSDGGILLPSIEPQETELIEIFAGRPDTNVQISRSCIIERALRNKKIDFGWPENHWKSRTKCVHSSDVTVRKTLFTA